MAYKTIDHLFTSAPFGDRGTSKIAHEAIGR